MQFNDASEITGREPERRYDPVDDDNRAVTMIPERESQPPRQGMFHAQKIGQLTLVLGMVIFVASFGAFSLNNRATTNTQASVSGLGPESLSVEERGITGSISEYPIAYNGKEIPRDIIQQGERRYLSIRSTDRKAYVINRVVLFYIIDEYLTKYDSRYIGIQGELTFEAIENNLPAMMSKVKSEYPDLYSNLDDSFSGFTYE